MLLEMATIFIGIISPIIIMRWKRAYEGAFKLTDLSKILSIVFVILPLYYVARKAFSPPIESLFIPYTILDFLLSALFIIAAFKLSPDKSNVIWKSMVKLPNDESSLSRRIAVLIFIALSTLVIWSSLNYNPRKLLQDDFINILAINRNAKFMGMLIPGYILSAIGEELVYRYFTINALRKLFAMNYTIIISAIIFTLMHGKIGFDIVIIGIFLGYLYYRTESLLLCILIHLLRNLVVMASSFFVFYNESGAISISPLQVAALLLGCQLLYVSIVEISLVKLKKAQAA